VAQDLPVGVEQRHAHVAHGSERLEARIARKKIEYPIGNEDQSPVFDHRLARRVGDGILEVRNVAVTRPEGESAQTALFREPFRNPSALRANGASEVLHQRAEEALSCLSRNAFDDLAQSSGVLVLRHLRQPHSAKRLTLCSAQKETRGPPNTSSAKCSGLRNIHLRESST